MWFLKRAVHIEWESGLDWDSACRLGGGEKSDTEQLEKQER